MSGFSWGVDGFGKCYLSHRGSNKILLSGLAGVSGTELIWLYEDFGA
tara:strand:- start:1956 stop:2096 length:141 start_codon:yes stop_codon:yes gene_type:complete